MIYKATFVTFCLIVTLFSPSLKASRTSGRQNGSGPPSVVKTTVFHGVIREDAAEGSEVKMDSPVLMSNRGALVDGEICGYTVYKTQSDFPFKITNVSRSTGAASVVLSSGSQLDFEQKHEYDFEVAAYDCKAARHAEREKVHIEIEDVNEFAPVWSRQSVSADAVEGRVYDYLVHLEAVDKDGADGVSKICRYRILTPDVPFEIDDDGYLRNTEPLDYNIKTMYSIDVKAEDCAGRSSEKAVVEIYVKPVCRPSWTGIADRVEFVPREGYKLIAGAAELEMCDGTCNITEIAVTVKLTTEHIGKGCDRDTYSLQSQRKICGASMSSIDLLPNPTHGSWTKELPTDDGLESDQIFAFDGKTTAIEIPSDKLDFNLGTKFTVSTWMKRLEEDEDDKDKLDSPRGTKEHLICHSDGEGMNRHHYSLFIHNCRLVLLLRREPQAESSSYDDDSDLQPAEWRWRIPQVCDGKWHHYAVSMEFPEVRLYIDGRHFEPSRHNPEIVDDWPLHSTKQVHSTKLVVGACWQGGKHKMNQYFRGYLAGLSILKNATESDNVIRCLNECQEKLDFDAIDTNDDTSVTINSERTTVTVKGSHLESVEKLMSGVKYMNSRAFPTPGHRPISFETNAVCANGQRLEVDAMTTLVMVVDAEQPTITITGTKSQDVSVNDLSHGVKLFPDAVIDARTKTEDSERIGSSNMKDSEEEVKLRDRFQLDSCLIRVDPQLSLTVEHLRYPENLVAQLGLDVDFSEDGLVIAGADKLSAYEEVLHGVRYVNSQPEELNSRTFAVSCTELNGRFTSNLLETVLLVVRVIPTPAPAHVAAAVNHVGLQQLGGPISKSVEFHKSSETSQSGVGVAAVIVACVGFVVLLMGLGVARIRNAKRHSRGDAGNDVSGAAEDRQEMEWDNSALTITVNPMDQEIMYDDELPTTRNCRDDSDSDEECSSAALNHDVMESSEEEEEEEVEQEEPEKIKPRELEWDDSTLSF